MFGSGLEVNKSGTSPNIFVGRDWKGHFFGVIIFLSSSSRKKHVLTTKMKWTAHEGTGKALCHVRRGGGAFCTERGEVGNKNIILQVVLLCGVE